MSGVVSVGAIVYVYTSEQTGSLDTGNNMATVTAPHIKGVIYNAEIITTDYNDNLYESVDALLLDIQSNPRNYGVTDEVASIRTKEAPDLYAPKVEWDRYHFQSDIEVWTVCEGSEDMTTEDDFDYCGSGAWYEGKYWCGWHQDLRIDYKWRDMVTVIKR